MSGRTRRIVIALVLLAILGTAWSYLVSDTRRLQRRLSELEDLLDKDGEEAAIVTAATAGQVARFFAPGFVILAAPYEGQLTDPQQLQQAVYRYRTAAPRIDATFGDREIELRDNRTAVLVFTALVVMDFGDRSGRESYRVRSSWAEIEGEWVVSELEVLEVLPEGPGLGLFPQ